MPKEPCQTRWASFRAPEEEYGTASGFRARGPVHIAARRASAHHGVLRTFDMVTRPRWSRSASRAAAPTRVEPPTWTTWREAVAVVLYRPHLRSTAAIALVVGTALFCINQLDVVLRGDATAVVWIKSAVTYLVPFCVSNAGVLVASRADRPGPG
jgi:hypothetical protein